MKFSGFYGWGAILGFSPRDVDQMSLWEFTACVDAHRKASGTEPEVKAPSADEYFEQVARLG